MFPIQGNQPDGTLYVDDVFSTYLYTGNGSTQTITNGIDLAGKGGMVWVKERSSTGYHRLYDTYRGTSSQLYTNVTNAAGTQAELSSYNSNGFTLTSLDGNLSPQTYVSWTFRKATKFFDVVTYTGNGSGSRSIPHALGTTIGAVIVKRTDAASDWFVAFRDSVNGNYAASTNDGTTFALNSTNAADGVSSANFTTTDFNTWYGSGMNVLNATYVAYLFAHDTTTDGIIQCGSFNGASPSTVNLGWEPQWILFKDTSSVTGWVIYDAMRGWSQTSGNYLQPNTSAAEGNTSSYYPVINSTGFSYPSGMTSGTTIYLAIRRPNKPPTSGTQVYASSAHLGTESIRKVITAGFPVDLSIQAYRNLSGVAGYGFYDRLRGGTQYLLSYSTNAEAVLVSPNNFLFDSNTTLTSGQGAWNAQNTNGLTFNLFRRAPGVFDICCYTGNGTGAPRDISHNLASIPELIIIKNRSFAESDAWPVFGSAIGADKWMNLYKTNAAASYAGAGVANTITTFRVPNGGSQWNNSPFTYVAYLFATKAGISCVTSYTGNGGSADSAGTSQTINCGFTTGSRFVMIKCTSHASDWILVDTARGLVAGNDPTLSLNTTAAEVTGQDLLDPDDSGFIVNQLGSAAGTSANFNVTGRTYIVLSFA